MGIIIISAVSNILSIIYMLINNSHPYFLNKFHLHYRPKIQESFLSSHNNSVDNDQLNTMEYLSAVYSYDTLKDIRDYSSSSLDYSTAKAQQLNSSSNLLKRIIKKTVTPLQRLSLDQFSSFRVKSEYIVFWIPYYESIQTNNSDLLSSHQLDFMITNFIRKQINTKDIYIKNGAININYKKMKEYLRKVQNTTIMTLDLICITYDLEKKLCTLADLDHIGIRHKITKNIHGTSMASTMYKDLYVDKSTPIYDHEFTFTNLPSIVTCISRNGEFKVYNELKNIYNASDMVSKAPILDTMKNFLELEDRKIFNA